MTHQVEVQMVELVAPHEWIVLARLIVSDDVERARRLYIQVLGE